MIRRFPLHLLRRHIGNRAKYDTGFRRKGLSPRILAEIGSVPSLRSLSERPVKSSQNWTSVMWSGICRERDYTALVGQAIQVPCKQASRVKATHPMGDNMDGTRGKFP